MLQDLNDAVGLKRRHDLRQALYKIRVFIELYESSFEPSAEEKAAFVKSLRDAYVVLEREMADVKPKAAEITE